MKRSIALFALTAGIIYGGIAASALAQANNFTPPASVKKYSFYPHGGNFFVDLFPTNFVDLDPISGLLAYNGVITLSPNILASTPRLPTSPHRRSASPFLRPWVERSSKRTMASSI